MRKRTGSWVLGLLLAWPGFSSGADFTFQVPVEVQNMAVSYTDGQVRCAVYRGEEELGGGVQLFSLNNLGAFQGTLTVRVDVPVSAGDDAAGPADAERWQCGLLFLQGREYQPAPADQAQGVLTVGGGL